MPRLLPRAYQMPGRARFRHPLQYGAGRHPSRRVLRDGDRNLHGARTARACGQENESLLQSGSVLDHRYSASTECWFLWLADGFARFSYLCRFWDT